MVTPDGEAAIDLRTHFAGFFGQNGSTVVPTFTVDVRGNAPFTASVEGTTLKVSAAKTGATGISCLTVTADDGQTAYTRRFGVAVSTNGIATPVQPAWSEEDIEVKSREFFTLDGHQVVRLHPHEVYLMKVTDTHGSVYTTKVIHD
jgi:hypothetical protein